MQIISRHASHIAQRDTHKHDLIQEKTSVFLHIYQSLLVSVSTILQKLK